MKYIIFLHRWLGIGGCLLFLAWFVSGIVMMYFEMPELSEDQRLAVLPNINSSRANLSASGAIERAHLLGVGSIKLTSLFGRPAWRLRGIEGSWCTVFADTGEVVRSFEYETARASIGPFVVPGADPRLLGTLDEPDQWTVSGDYDDFFPLYHVALNDPDGTELYVSATTGEVVLRSTARTRLLAWFGAIPHWIYFTGIRKHAQNWRLLVIWLSGAGCVVALLGLMAGIWRWAQSPRDWSPYRGAMRWHHGAGLIFGTLTLTWTFSGMLSLEPGHYTTGSSPTEMQREAFSGKQDYSVYTESPARLLQANPSVKELELYQVAGQPYYLIKKDGRKEELVHTDGRPAGDFPLDFLLAAAQRAVPQGHIVNRDLMTLYDAYYFDREGHLPLPVLRVKFDDAAQSWLYIDPRHVSITARYERSGRIDRWLYHGLHHLDFPFLWSFRPAWDIVVLALLAGGIFLSSTGVLIGFRRLRISLQRLAAKIHPDESKRIPSKFGPAE